MVSLAFIVAACTVAAHVTCNALGLIAAPLPALLPLAPAPSGLIVQCACVGVASALAVVLYVVLVASVVDVPESRWIRAQLVSRLRPGAPAPPPQLK